jgi:hypothetical protein
MTLEQGAALLSTLRSAIATRVVGQMPPSTMRWLHFWRGHLLTGVP